MSLAVSGVDTAQLRLDDTVIQSLILQNGPSLRQRDLLVEEALEEGRHHLDLSDPFDRSVALVFGLISTHDFDPWAIDLHRFIELFTERIETTEGLDLPACGRLLRLAWGVLAGRAEELLGRQQMMDVEEDDYWDGSEIDGWQSDLDDASFEFTMRMVDGTGHNALESLLSPRLRRDEGRPVTLTELLAGLSDGQDDMAIRAELEANRKRHAANLELALSNVSNRAHDENLEGDLERVWQNLQSLDGGKGVSMPDLRKKMVDVEGVTEDLDRREVEVATFIAVLFLTRLSIAKISQSDAGVVHIRNLWPEANNFHEAQALGGQKGLGI